MNDLITACRAARQAYQQQERLMRGGATGIYNGRYAAKTKRLYTAWQQAEKELLKAIYA